MRDGTGDGNMKGNKNKSYLTADKQLQALEARFNKRLTVLENNVMAVDHMIKQLIPTINHLAHVQIKIEQDACEHKGEMEVTDDGTYCKDCGKLFPLEDTEASENDDV